MELNTRLCKIYIDPTLFIFILISIFSPAFFKFFELFYVCYLFIIFHECGHILVACILGKNVNKVSFYLSGCNADIDEGIYSKYLKNRLGIKDLIIRLAGPISNIILAILLYKIPFVFEINIFLGLMNLLPIAPLDGYQSLFILLSLNKSISKRNVIKYTFYINNFFILLTFILGVILLIFFYNFSLLLMTIYVTILSMQERKNVEIYSKFDNIYFV